ncbi:MAG TPA: dienelactone hydrolase family protein [Burkholderiales bacterium]|nr:dienelactone hydrolase family protein [Burkholderiales bacterium]
MRLLAFAFVFVAANAAAASERVRFGEIAGILHFPEQPGRHPAIVIVHGSAGVAEAREGFWARELAAFGMVTLVTDSFAPRGVDSTTDDQSRVTTTQMLRDAFAALAFLAAREEVDEKRIAIMGMSKGGSVALLAVDRQAQRGGRAFAAHLPLYPACALQYRNPHPTAPVLMLIGEKDSYTGVKLCAAYAERLRAAGGQVQLKTYPGAHHGFDGDTMNPREFYLPRAQTYRDCVILIEDDGRVAQPERRCMRVGATVAANHRAKMQALEDVKGFLKATLFH